MKPLLFVLTAFLGLAWQSADAAPYHLIHAFRGGDKDGRTPTYESSLTVSGSVFYGMTQDGGRHTNGVVFQINTDGTHEQLIHTFNGWSILNMKGSTADGAYPVGTPVLSGSTLYGVTQQGGSNGPSYAYGMGTVFSVNTDTTGFQILHNFGAYLDGSTPVGSLVLQGSTLYGMTEAGGTNNALQGTIFSIETNGSGYHVLYNFDNDGGSPQGSLLLWGSTLYGMTAGEIFEIQTNGTTFLPVHVFAGAPNDGDMAYGSVIRSGAYLYGMTSGGGANSVGAVFQLNLIGSHFQLLHSFSIYEANKPFGDLVLSGSTLYGMTYGGVTNYHGGYAGSGSVFQIDTNGNGYQVMHTFLFPGPVTDGSLPFGTPIVLGSDLYGMTSLGGSEGLPLDTQDGGVIFSLTLAPGSGSGGGTPPTITTTSPLPNGKVGVAYHQQLAASGGTSPYTWSVSSGHLPPGLTLTAGGLLSGKPTKGDIAAFTVKVTGHDKMSSDQPFGVTIEATPTLTIVTPKSGQRFTATPIATPLLNVSGTASDALDNVAGVYFQLNGGAWTLANTANGFANWNYSFLPLAADENVLSAYAVDSFGNHSKTNAVKFEYYVTGLLIVETNGNGSFTPRDDNGKDLQIGATSTITAIAGRGFEFVNWTNGMGIVLTNKATLKFAMESNLILVANFAAVPGSHLAHDSDLSIARTKTESNPFLGASGIYYGLFAPPEGARQITDSGAIRLAVSESGSFSGKFLLGPDTIPFSGSFDADGSAQILATGKVTCMDCPWARFLPSTRIVMAQNKINLNGALRLDFAHESVAGEVTDGAFVAHIAAYRGAMGSSVSARNYQGTYAVAISGADNSTLGPLSAAGTVAVDAFGNVTFEGTLPDGTRASQTSLISREGYWPLYVQSHWGSGPQSGSLWAWNQLTNGGVRSLPMAARWAAGTNQASVQITGSVGQPPNDQ